MKFTLDHSDGLTVPITNVKMGKMTRPIRERTAAIVSFVLVGTLFYGLLFLVAYLTAEGKA